MKNIALVSSLLMLTVTNAFAQESKKEKKEPVSKLENQIVKVGDKNQYLYAYERFNVGVNLFGLVYDYASVSASIALTENVAFRLAGSLYYGGETDDDYLNSVSAGFPIYFSKMYTGFFIEPGVDLRTLTYVAVGYHWMWDSGFNLHAAIGAARKGAIGFFQIGYAFGGDK